MSEQILKEPAWSGGREHTRAVFSVGKEGLEIHIAGPLVVRPNIRVFQECVNTLLECAQRCTDLTNPLEFLDQTFKRFAGHNLETNCFSEGFGLKPSEAGVRKERSAGTRIMELGHGPAKVSQVEDGLRIHVIGPLAEKLNVELLQSCTNAVLSCMETNQCGTERGIFHADCFNTLLPQFLRTDCISEGLGLLPKAPIITHSSDLA